MKKKYIGLILIVIGLYLIYIGALIGIFLILASLISFAYSPVSRTLKQSMKKDWRNIVRIVSSLLLFVILFGFFSTFIANPYMLAYCGPCGCPTSWGYPLSFYNEQKIASSINPLCGETVPIYNYFNLIIDIIFWYVISFFIAYLIVWIYDKFRKATNK